MSRGDDELGLAPDQVRCDVWAFEAAIDQGRPADALALYRGELLAGLPHLSRAGFRALARRGARPGEAAGKEAAGRWRPRGSVTGTTVGAAEAARRRSRSAPADEAALRRLVLLLERLGDRAGAVRAYEDFAWQLRGEYELEPSAETQALVARIRAEPGESHVGRTGPSQWAFSRGGERELQCSTYG